MDIHLTEVFICLRRNILYRSFCTLLALFKKYNSQTGTLVIFEMLAKLQRTLYQMSPDRENMTINYWL